METREDHDYLAVISVSGVFDFHYFPAENPTYLSSLNFSFFRYKIVLAVEKCTISNREEKKMNCMS